MSLKSQNHHHTRPCRPQENEDPASGSEYTALKPPAAVAGAGAAEGRLICSASPGRRPLQQVAPDQHNSRLPPLTPPLPQTAAVTAGGAGESGGDRDRTWNAEGMLFWGARGVPKAEVICVSHMLIVQYWPHDAHFDR